MRCRHWNSLRHASDALWNVARAVLPLTSSRQEWIFHQMSARLLIVPKICQNIKDKKRNRVTGIFSQLLRKRFEILLAHFILFFFFQKWLCCYWLWLKTTFRQQSWAFPSSCFLLKWRCSISTQSKTSKAGFIWFHASRFSHIERAIFDHLRNFQRPTENGVL